MATTRNSTATTLLHTLVRGEVSATSAVCADRRPRVSGPCGCCELFAGSLTGHAMDWGKIGATAADATHREIRHRPTLSRLRIPAHWLVLRSTVEEMSGRNAGAAWLLPSEPLAFVLRGTGADALHAEGPAVGVRSRGGPTNPERSCVADHTFGARRPPTARARGADEPGWCEARPFARQHRSVSGGIVRETGRNEPCRGDKGCVSARLVDAVIERPCD